MIVLQFVIGTMLPGAMTDNLRDGMLVDEALFATSTMHDNGEVIEALYVTFQHLAVSEQDADFRVLTANLIEKTILQVHSLFCCHVAPHSR